MRQIYHYTYRIENETSMTSGCGTYTTEDERKSVVACQIEEDLEEKLHGHIVDFEITSIVEPAREGGIPS